MSQLASSNLSPIFPMYIKAGRRPLWDNTVQFMSA